MVGTDNAVGIAGMASAASLVLCSSHFDAGLGVSGFVSDAVVAGIAQLARGDVMLIEVQVGFCPAEVVDDTFESSVSASSSAPLRATAVRISTPSPTPADCRL